MLVAFEEFARVRLECQHAEGRVDPFARVAGDVDDVAMAQVDAVEITDGGRGTPIRSGGKVMVAHDPHEAGVAPDQGRRKPLWRRARIVSAAPTQTAVTSAALSAA